MTTCDYFGCQLQLTFCDYQGLKSPGRPDAPLICTQVLPVTEAVFLLIEKDCLSGNIPRWSGLLTNILDCTER
ncbi:hypothetical protein L873DRAFT_1822029 [Choiromyces venosus 120613-1]|uniref:Uncharacterized protein n=1 Tax=Choiromyces venosus 120613-1 TaxID=1336337 RepID=A0A3N4IUR3_9PEZI|nr:hypothetical protein L873DRAFT_1822029 [Choiromyces venosus 120613-1]